MDQNLNSSRALNKAASNSMNAESPSSKDDSNEPNLMDQWKSPTTSILSMVGVAGFVASVLMKYVPSGS